MDEGTKSNNIVDTLYNISSGFYHGANPTLFYGEVNEITPEEQKQRRNRQLAISLIVVAGIAVLYYFYTRKKK
jgi:hypothetical protein